MHIKLDVNTEIEVKEITDLPRLKILMEGLHMKKKASWQEILMLIVERLIGT